ncbi:alpha/beta fold hydrolase [Erwinia sp. CPCC 100877]|nr:alpha/beta fold hydrolase [Erwinia sp. CPCC 100877]
MKKEKKFLTTLDHSLIYYEVSGEGFPLILLHGNGGSGEYFKKQIPDFSKYFTVYVIDSRGHGRSTNRRRHLSFDQMADDLAVLMQAEHIVQADVVGFSDGANLAMLFTKKYPQKVHRLVLNAGNTQVKGVHFSARLFTFLTYPFFKFFAIFSKRAQQKLAILQLMLSDIGVTTADLQKITQKTLVIVGKYDLIKRSHSLYLAKEIPHASFVLAPRQGHSFALKAPQLFNQEVLSFLRK